MNLTKKKTLYIEISILIFLSALWNELFFNWATKEEMKNQAAKKLCAACERVLGFPQTFIWRLFHLAGPPRAIAKN